MNKELIEKLSPITEEEQEHLDGKTTINRALYYSKDSGSSSDEVDSARVLKNGRLIDMRPHVRFVHFPKHTHNYVEFIYMVKGSTTHIVDNQEIVLKEGDLLFLNQHAIQEIRPAGKNDIAVNFMILPEFFDVVLPMMGNETNSLRDFLVSCLTKKDMVGNFLYFNVSGVLPIQNLMENLIWNMLEAERNSRTLNQITVGLLFLNLMNHTDLINVSQNSYEQELVLDVLRYIDTNYKEASLKDFAQQKNMDIYTISRILKQSTGKNFKELLQSKRLDRACMLLSRTNAPIADIADSVGYDNTSFFHRLFRRIYGCSPREYRLAEKTQSFTHPL
ncbi:MAG: helix-turn-helix domain-containing protein [Butyrivibrio sp.]|nr:helix-turn-helix domain-containing protein [Butyrivibrio sp.]